jgi:hypothetical protein
MQKHKRLKSQRKPVRQKQKRKKTMSDLPENVHEVLKLLDIHYKSFIDVKPYADKYGHPHPSDTRAWSQILISALTGIKGIARKKGADLDDGSDVKGANTWGAIDTPRFNGCLKTGTKSKASGTMKSLNKVPNLFFVLWDSPPTRPTSPKAIPARNTAITR